MRCWISRVNFIEAEVARIDPHERRVTIANGEVEGTLHYDYLIFALGRRLATERITGFYEHAHHLLNVDKAIKFGKAVSNFHEGRAVIGQCAGARLPIPVFEAAFALARRLEENNERERVKITIVSPDEIGSEFPVSDVGIGFRKPLTSTKSNSFPAFPSKRLPNTLSLPGGSGTQLRPLNADATLSRRSSGLASGNNN